MNKYKIRFAALLVALLLTVGAGGCASDTVSNGVGSEAGETSVSMGMTGNAAESSAAVSAAEGVDPEDLDDAWDEATATKITLSGDTATVDGDGAKAQGSTVTIDSGGTYLLSGELQDGQIVVTAPKTTTVRLVLNGVGITSTQNAAIYCSQADKLIVTLAEGTENTLTDASSYTYADTTAEEPDAALFSKVDLSINGKGSLTVMGNFNNGIGTKDDLVLAGGSLTVDAVKDGIRGRDSVTALDGNVKITAGSDGIQSNNDEDVSKGWIAISGGSFDITAANDGIQAQTNLLVSGGEFALVTGGGSGGTATATTDSDSFKGLKSGTNLTLSGGTFSVDSADDTIHTNGSILLSGGEYTLASGDDGIHADGDLTITGGNINVTKSYEGLEASTMTISDGTINVVARDDGINIAGGTDEDSGQGGFGADRFSANSNRYLHITGGVITVDASGDGIDVNGNAEMSGGEVYVNGPTGGGNGALDYDGTFDITGGILVAAGSNGMAMAPSSTSTQPSIMLYYTANQAAGTPVELSAADGMEIISYTPAKDYQTIVISTPKLALESAYTVSSAGTKVVDVTLSTAVTSISDTGEAVSGGMGRGMGGQRPGGGMGGTPPDGVMPERGSLPEGFTPPEGGRPGGRGGQRPGEASAAESSTTS